MQHIIVKHLLGTTRADDVHAALTRRLSKWHTHENAQAAASRVVQLMKAQAKHVPSFVLAAYLKTVTNAWATKARFGSRAPCPLGCGKDDGSRVEHIMECPGFHACAKPYFKHWHGWPTAGTFLESLALHMGHDSTKAAAMMIWHDVAHQVYFVLKHCGGRPHTHVQARVRAIARHHKGAKDILVRCHRGQA